MPAPLVACPSCACHVRAGEAACIHCGAPIRQRDGTVPRTAAAVLLGLAVAGAASSEGCSSKSDPLVMPAYGIAAKPERSGTPPEAPTPPATATAYGIAVTDPPVEPTPAQSASASAQPVPKYRPDAPPYGVAATSLPVRTRPARPPKRSEEF